MTRPIALFFILTLLTLSCHKNGKSPAIDKWADYRKAYELLSVNKDSAFLHFNRLADNSKDRQQVALAYYNMALIQSYSGDHFGAQESLTLSFRSLDERQEADRDFLATDFNELSMTCYNLKEYQAAMGYAERALQYTDNPELVQYIRTNLGNAHQKLRRYDQALKSYRQIIPVGREKASVYARTLTNIAITKWLKDNTYNAVPELMSALRVRLQEKDRWGLNSSYAHLSDYYVSKQSDSALLYAQKMYSAAKDLNSPDDELEALQKLARSAPKNHISTYFFRYQKLNDSLEIKRKAAKNQFAVIRYGVEKNKSDNLRLKQENTIKTYQLASAFALLIFFSVGAYFWFRRKRLLAQIDADARVSDTRLRLSKKVHDVVANGIYAVMNEVLYSPNLIREDILDKLEIMYEQSRDISHDSASGPLAEFSDEITNLLKTFKSPEIRFALTGNEEGLWQAVNNEIRSEIKTVLLELLVNMRKHSRASQALLSFSIENTQLLVIYRDNGVGLNAAATGGNGIRNTVSRISALGGEVTFASNTLSGAAITIAVPLK